MPPLLQRLTERKPETLDYLGVSYGLTPQLLRWVLFVRTNVPRLINSQLLEEGGICPSVYSTDDKRTHRRAYMPHVAWAEQLCRRRIGLDGRICERYTYDPIYAL